MLVWQCMDCAIINCEKQNRCKFDIRLPFFALPQTIISTMISAYMEASRDYITGNTKSFVLCFTLMMIAFHFDSVQSHQHRLVSDYQYSPSSSPSPIIGIGCVCITKQQKWNGDVSYLPSSEEKKLHTSSFVIAAVVRLSMMEVATDASTALISAALEVMLAKFMAACSGDVLNSYECVDRKPAFKSVNLVFLYHFTGP